MTKQTLKELIIAVLLIGGFSFMLFMGIQSLSNIDNTMRNKLTEYKQECEEICPTADFQCKEDCLKWKRRLN